jgi:type VI secretion system secreted protein VgrG
VKVHFFWDRKGKKDDKSSCWIRVSQSWGGAKWGGMFIPHVGQEVIVGFEEGDPDRPLITGRVYNAEVMPPLELPANKTKSAIRDHGGNEIIMEGDGGKQHMRLFSPTHKTTMTLGNSFDFETLSDWVARITGNRDTQINGSSSTRIDGDTTERFYGIKDEFIRGVHSEVKLGAHSEFVVGVKHETHVGLKLSHTGAAQIEVNKGPRAESYPAAYRKSKAFIKEKASMLALVAKLHTSEVDVTKLKGKRLNQNLSADVVCEAPKITWDAPDKVYMDTAVFQAVAKMILEGKLNQKSGSASLAGGNMKCDE